MTDTNILPPDNRFVNSSAEYVARLRANVPEELRTRPQWVVWRKEVRNGESKPTKVPYTSAGRRAKSDTPSTWSTFDAALAAFERGGWNGLGYVFSADDPYVGIDFDACIANGVIDPEIEEMVRVLGSYTERSQSGNGLHVIVRGEMPGGKGRKSARGEMYNRLRFFVVTGDHVEGTPTAVEDRQAQIPATMATLFPDTSAAPTAPHSEGPAASINKDDTELWDLMLRSRSGNAIHSLFAGDLGDHAGDESAADLALCNHLAFWTGRDAGRMDRLFRQTGLMRPKWEREDYRTMTIDKAIGDCREVYTGRLPTASPPDPYADAPHPAENVYMPPVNGNYGFDATLQIATSDEMRDEAAAAALQQTTGWTAYSRDSDGHALAVVERRGAHIRYCEQLGWLAWNGKCWATDDADAAVTEAVREVLRERVSEQAAIPGGDMAQRVRSCVPTAGNVDGVVRLLGRTMALRIGYKALDPDTDLLNVQNGVVNLRTGALLPHDPALLMTHVAAVAYDPTATAPTWERFIEQMLPDPAMRVFVQRLLGYALTGDASEQVLFYWWGSGNNGKSTALDAVRNVLGDYSMQASPELLVEDEGHKPEQAQFLGRRLVTMQEVSEGKRMNVTLMKYATGERVMRARHLYQEGMEFRVTAKMIVSANNKLVIRETDDGTWRRILLTPWTVSIPKGEVDKRLPERLDSELAGILNWLVAGAMGWYIDGLAVPGAVTTASADYRAESDAIGAWLDACTVGGSAMQCSSSALYASYKTWCDSNGYKALASNSWAGKLQDRGLAKDRTSVGVIWSGVGLLHKTDAENV